jgi:hypothetical protein
VSFGNSRDQIQWERTSETDNYREKCVPSACVLSLIFNYREAPSDPAVADVWWISMQRW